MLCLYSSIWRLTILQHAQGRFRTYFPFRIRGLQKRVRKRLTYFAFSIRGLEKRDWKYLNKEEGEAKRLADEAAVFKEEKTARNRALGVQRMAAKAAAQEEAKRQAVA